LGRGRRKMGWGSFAEKLNRTIGGYDSNEEEEKKLSEGVVPEMKVEPMMPPPKKAKEGLPENCVATGPSLKCASGGANSIYDAPAITRDSMPIDNTALSNRKPRKARKPKQKLSEEEQVPIIAT
jgi:hypothetical protein